MRTDRERRARRRQGLAFIVLALAVLGVVAVWSNSTLTARAKLEHDPVSSLTYPGAEFIRAVGQDGGANVDGPVPATSTRQFGSADTLEPILAFYRTQFATAGWTTGGGSSIVGSGIERQICAWYKDGEVARLSFLKPEEWLKLHPGDDRYATVFEVALIERTPTLIGPNCANPD